VENIQRTYSIVGPKSQVAPNIDAIDAFWAKAIAENPSLQRDHQVRWIGLDEETTAQIISFIKSGEKTATFTLPWVNSFYSWPDGYPGLPIILMSCVGEPLLVVQITETIQTTFGAVDFSVTSLDGPPVREVPVWLALHTQYWNGILKDLDMECTSDMPVLVEKFVVKYPL